MRPQLGSVPPRKELAEREAMHPCTWSRLFFSVYSRCSASSTMHDHCLLLSHTNEAIWPSGGVRFEINSVCARDEDIWKVTAYDKRHVQWNGMSDRSLKWYFCFARSIVLCILGVGVFYKHDYCHADCKRQTAGYRCTTVLLRTEPHLIISPSVCIISLTEARWIRLIRTLYRENFLRCVIWGHPQ